MRVSMKNLDSVWSAISPAPIHVFSVKDLGISKKAFVRENAPVFHNLDYDWYDVRREQIEWLIRRIPLHQDEQTKCEELWSHYFQGKVGIENLKPLIDRLSSDDKQNFDTLAP